MRISSIVMAFVALTLCSISAFAEGVSLHQALQRMVDRHPSLKTAALQAERSALDQVRVESQLGWNMGGSAGLGHDVNFIGVPSSTLNVGANLSKKLESGDQLGLNGRYSYEDSELAFGSLPNPSHRTQFDLSYRKPLWQGAGNARYQEGLAKAKYGSQIAELSLLNIRDQLAQQLIDVYFNLILTTARLQNVDQSVARAHRLANHVLKNRKLGLSEDKDILQLEAQLASLESNRAGLEVAKGQLEIRLKQLMWSDKGSSPQVDIANLPKVTKDVNQDVYMAVEKYNPQIKINELRAQIADSQIREARDSKEDKLDTVFSVGMRTADGTSLVGSPQETTVSEQDYAASVTIEFSKQVDKSGLQAVLSQAMLDRSIALQEKELIRQDLHYRVDVLRDQLQRGALALKQAQTRRDSEHKKMKEAQTRYDTGRADTFQIIQFENELALAELAVQEQGIEQSKRTVLLQLLSGQLWADIVSNQNQIVNLSQ